MTMFGFWQQPSPRHTARGAWRLTLAGAVALLAGCSVTPHQAGGPALAAVPAQWYAPTPAPAASAARAVAHNGRVEDLGQWWQQHNDPALLDLILQAQAASPTLAAARVNLEQARLARAAEGAALLPRLNAVANATRSNPGMVNGVSPGLQTSNSAGLQASWEIDLFGRQRGERDAQQQRLEGSQAEWHAARVSVAAEVAQLYYSRRNCEQLLQLTQTDADSRSATARLVGLSAQAGFEAPAQAALARASAAQGRSQATAQASQCALDLKALTALTALPEPEVQQRLALASTAVGTVETDIVPPVVSVPAAVLAQRPDVFQAARELDAASLDVGIARAQRYPSLTLNGAITGNRAKNQGKWNGFSSWSFGPLQLSVPVFDGGASRANVQAALVRYDAAKVRYQATARQAVREVEEALVQLQSTADRRADARAAATDYRSALDAAQALYQSGLGSLLALEDTRRAWLSAQSAELGLQLERRMAWITLYRALGGGWSTEQQGPDAPESEAPSSDAPASVSVPAPSGA